MTYYEFVHLAGYGRDDHMADEIIARAARQLGYNTGNSIAQAAGLASHPVPNRRCTVRLASGRGVRQRMTAALRAALAELPFRADCSVVVVRRRQRTEVEKSTFFVDGFRCGANRTTHYLEEWRGGGWVVIDSREVAS